MAKGKHAAALFEVIHADRRFGKKTPPARALSTPKWWFKGKKTEAPAPPAAPSAAAPAPSPVRDAAVPEPMAFMPSVPADPTAARPVDVKVNPDRQEISFKLTYTSAIVGAFTLLVVLSLAYVIGRKMNAGPAGAIAASISTSDVRKGAPRPGVMDLAKAERDGVAVSIVPDRDESARVVDPTPAAPRNTVPQVQQQPPQPQHPGQTTIVVDDPNRTIGLNYVVIQSFRHEQKDLADEAVKYLREGGIGATAVKDLPGWQGWYSVVGTRGFDRTKNNPQYDAYIAQIMEVSPKFAGRSQWKRFAPTPKRWSGNP